MASTPVVNFPAFRQHTRAREDANTAIMGLLVGSQMAAHFLTLTDGSDHLLPSIFPGVPHVGRFNLTSKAARDVLVRADQHLGTMAVPYALSIHEDLMRSCTSLAGGSATQSAKALHSTLALRTGGKFDVDSLAQFHVLREMRNAVIHSGGVIDQRVVDCAAAMSSAAVDTWKRIVGRSPCGLTDGARIEFGTGELFLALAATKNLAKQANLMLIPALTVPRWCELIVEDFIANGPATRNPDQRRGKLLGWANFHYRSIGATEAQLVVAGTAGGLRL